MLHAGMYTTLKEVGEGRNLKEGICEKRGESTSNGKHALLLGLGESGLFSEK